MTALYETEINFIFSLQAMGLSSLSFTNFETILS